MENTSRLVGLLCAVRRSEAPIPWSEADPFSISMYAQASWARQLKLQSRMPLPALMLLLERSQRIGAASKRMRR